ncbi:5-formyltetrahydrofolate cyclo-ligase [Vagococcus sp.]|uniref:5-formyltetrahydrofolate cyclo-ligase n=1 Tax=Vagococcus sp. TaxID=1933889 RepID=UPI003F9AF773
MRDKKQVRKETLKKLSELGQNKEWKELKEWNIIEQLCESSAWKQATTVGTILPMDKEFDTLKLIKRALLENKKIVVPKTKPERQMIFVNYAPGEETYLTNFGVKEPVNDSEVEKNAIDLLIVPGVAFSENGYRVGFGGGYYDRYLADFKNETCSLAFQEQVCNDWTPSHYDLPVKNIIIDGIK